MAEGLRGEGLRDVVLCGLSGEEGDRGLVHLA